MRVEVLGGVERRRRWSRDDKTRIIEETLPPGEGRFVDVGARSRFPFCEHSAISQSVIARAQAVAMDEIRDPQGRESGFASTRRADPPGRYPCWLRSLAISE
jgi:hypothetical protein